MRGWAVPFVQSRLLPGDFHPLIAYLFTEYKCNLDCHYCYSFDNRVKGMSEQTARASIDWLHSTTCRLLALMGGEVILRPPFVHKVVDYAAKKGFWIYIPTNGRLLRPDVIDRLADAGTATFNLAVDASREAWAAEGADADSLVLRYLVKKQYRYGYTVFFNINICRNNLDDVKALTEIAHDHKISTDYHINEAPLIDQPHFKHLDENPTYFRPEDHERVDEVIDWLIEKQKSGYGMLNSVERLAEMKQFLRGAHQEPWNAARVRTRDHPGGRDARAMLSDVLRNARLGHGRLAQVRAGSAGQHENVVRAELLLHAESHRRLVLQRHARDQMVREAGAVRIPGHPRQSGIAPAARCSSPNIRGDEPRRR